MNVFSFDQCNRKETFSSISFPCPSNSVISKNNKPMCVTCPDGKVYDNDMDKCTVPSLPLKREYVKLKKINCIDNKCTKIRECPKTTIESNDRCYAPCDTGFQIKDDKCVPINKQYTEPTIVSPLTCKKETPYLYSSDMLCHDSPAPIPSTSSLVKSSS